MNESRTEKTGWKKIVAALRKLAFSSVWDFLKTVVVGVLLFAWGNFLGLLYEPPRSLNIGLSCIGQCEEGYGSLRSVFDDIKEETENEVSFDPPGLSKLRVCKELDWDDTGRRMDYLSRIVDEFGQCIKLDVDTTAGAKVSISKVENSSQLESVEINGTHHWFCGCGSNVLDAFKKASSGW